MDFDQIYCADHFPIYTNIQSLCGKIETNMMFYVSYISI